MQEYRDLDYQSWTQLGGPLPAVSMLQVASFGLLMYVLLSIPLAC